MIIPIGLRANRMEHLSPTVLLLLAALPAMARGETLDRSLLRLSEEAEAFARLAPQVIGQETLEQTAAEAPPRFRPRGGAQPAVYRTRIAVSEYGYATLPEDPGNLHEVRSVLQVDGRAVKAPASLRETLSMGLSGKTDRLKKKLLRQFESYGFGAAATDFGQVILLFTRRQMDRYQFQNFGPIGAGPERVLVVRFRQKEGESAVTVFEGRQVARHSPSGELWLRESDGLPLRIVLDVTPAAGSPLSHRAVVEYRLSDFGALLPARVTHTETFQGALVVKNEFRYSDFRRFGASSEVKFDAAEPPRP